MCINRELSTDHVEPELEQDLTSAVQCDAPVLITGESRIGNRDLAAAIHSAGRRAARTFVSVDCAAVPGGLLLSQLFGRAGDSARGLQTTVGLLEQAHGGTIFLANIGAISHALQARLVRFLETAAICRVGNQLVHARVDVRVISSADRHLFARTQTMGFREDLYYRLNVLHLVVPRT